MTGIKIVGIVMIIAGVLALALGGFGYTRETHSAKVGSLELSVKDRETVRIPAWAGLGLVLVGGALFAAGARRP